MPSASALNDELPGRETIAFPGDFPWDILWRTLYRRSPHGHARVNGSVDPRLAGWLIRTHTQAKSRVIKAALTAAAIAARDAADGRSVAVRTRGRQQQRDDDDSDATADMPPQVGDAYSTAFEASMRSQGYPHFTYWSRKMGGPRGNIPSISGYHRALANRAKVEYHLNGYMTHVATKSGRIFR